MGSAASDGARHTTAKKGAKLFGLVPQNFSHTIDAPAMVQANPFTVRILVAQSLVQHGSATCEPTSEPPSSCNWASIDLEMGAAAAAGAIPLPFMYGKSNKPPVKGDAANQWKKFLKSAVKRYGPGGLYWQGQFQAQYPGAEKKVVKIWQIWNEPGSPTYFKNPNVGKYVKLLKLSGKAIHSVKKDAKIMLAGLFSSTDKGAIKGRIPAVEFMKKMYNVKGAKVAFDIAALHPYARNVNDMINQIEMVRNVMKQNQDGAKKLAITELGWSSNKSNGSLLAKGPEGQANTLQAAFKELLKAKGKYKLYTVDWFALRDAEKHQSSCPNCPYAGLLKVDGSHKKSWNKFVSFTK